MSKDFPKDVFHIILAFAACLLVLILDANIILILVSAAALGIFYQAIILKNRKGDGPR